MYYFVAAILAGSANLGSDIEFVTHVTDVRSVGETSVPSAAFEQRQDAVAFYLLRGFGALLLGLLVIQIGRLAVLLQINPMWPVLFASTLPQLSFISSSISNDALTALLGATATLSILHWYLSFADDRDTTRSKLFVAGMWAAAAFLSKKSALIFLPAGLLLIALACSQTNRVGSQERTKNSAWIDAALFALGWFLLASPLLARNQAVYGDMLGTWVENYTLSGLVTPRSLASTYFLKEFPLGLASSFVGNFGWLNVQVPMRIVAAYLIMILPGLLASMGRVRTDLRFAYLWAIIALNVAALIYYNLSYTQSQGRLIFPSIAALACVWGAGTAAVIRADSARRRLPIAVGALLVVLDIYTLLLNANAYR